MLQYNASGLRQSWIVVIIHELVNSPVLPERLDLLVRSWANAHFARDCLDQDAMLTPSVSPFGAWAHRPVRSCEGPTFVVVKACDDKVPGPALPDRMMRRQITIMYFVTPGTNGAEVL